MPRKVRGVIGKQGSGKSWLVKKKIIPESRYKRLLIIDPKGEYVPGDARNDGLSDFHMAMKGAKVFTDLNKLIGYVMAQDRFKAVYVDRSCRRFEFLARLAIKRRNIHLVADEASSYIPKRLIDAQSPEKEAAWWVDLTRIAREDNVEFTYLAQEATLLPTNFINQSDEIYLFNQVNLRSIKTMAELAAALPGEGSIREKVRQAEERIPLLGVGEHLFFNFYKMPGGQRI